MNPYHEFAAAFVRLVHQGRELPLGGLPFPVLPAPAASAPRALLFSPHPDDECVTGGLALRLARQAGFRVVNVAVTLGSHRARQLERWEELRQACRWLGFDLERTAPQGLEGIKLETRQRNPKEWSASVQVIATILTRHQPRVVFCPHDLDWNGTHIGTHFLVMDALSRLPSDFKCDLVETEFWGQMQTPNLMVELGPAEVGNLLAALSFHVGEVSRNPYHLRLPSWLQDNVRRGAELVGGQGAAAPAYEFALLHRLRRWQDGRLEARYEGGRLLGGADAPGSLFEGLG
jgi:N-acetylglucosamine malate deacetylase 1